MRITQLHIEGEPGRFAVLRRKRGSAEIDIEFLAPEGERRTSVPAGDRDALRRAAGVLQCNLEGTVGARGDVRSYLTALELIGNL